MARVSSDRAEVVRAGPQRRHLFALVTAPPKGPDRCHGNDLGFFAGSRPMREGSPSATPIDPRGGLRGRARRLQVPVSGEVTR
jgi:hypothetical protein